MDLDSDSSDDIPMVRVSSAPKHYSEVPEDRDFKLKFYAEKKTAFIYTLQQGKPLPYQTVVKGFSLKFDKQLNVDINETNWEKIQDGDITIFKKLVRENVDSTEHSTNSSPQVQVQVVEEQTLPVVETDTDPFIEFVDQSGAVVKYPMDVFAGLYTLVGNKLMCNICGHDEGIVDVDNIPVHVICLHIIQSHPIQVSPSSSQAKRVVGNVNNNPNWFQDLKDNFFLEIVSKTSEKTRNAWLTNENIEDGKKFIEVRTEILRGLINKIVDIYGVVSTPNHKVLSNVVSSILAPGYPFMFSSTDDSAHGQKLGFGYAKGGLKGVSELHKQLWDKIYQKQSNMRKASQPSTSNDPEAANVPAKKGKKPVKYGIDDYKWYAPATEEEKARYSQSDEIQDTEQREAVYSVSRAAIANQIRSSTKVLTKVIRGFFSDPLHLHNQFKHFTSEDTELRPRIEENWSTQVGYMTLYLRKKANKKNDLEAKLLDLDNRVQTDYNGSSLMKEVCIVRMLADVLDKDGRGLFLLPGEASVTTSPYIAVIVLPDNSLKFDLHADNQKIFEGQNIFQALTSYYELCFTFQLHYAKEAELTASIIQSKVAKYGDDSGTLTPMRRDTAQNKLLRYYSVIGDIVTSK